MSKSVPSRRSFLKFLGVGAAATAAAKASAEVVAGRPPESSGTFKAPPCTTVAVELPPEPEELKVISEQVAVDAWSGLSEDDPIARVLKSHEAFFRTESNEVRGNLSLLPFRVHMNTTQLAQRRRDSLPDLHYVKLAELGDLAARSFSDFARRITLRTVEVPWGVYRMLGLDITTWSESSEPFMLDDIKVLGGAMLLDAPYIVTHKDGVGPGLRYHPDLRDYSRAHLEVFGPEDGRIAISAVVLRLDDSIFGPPAAVVS